jgi:hypothetical protein
MLTRLAPAKDLIERATAPCRDASPALTEPGSHRRPLVLRAHYWRRTEPALVPNLCH